MVSLAFVQAFLESFKGFLSQATLISVLTASVLILFCAILLLLALLLKNRLVSYIVAVAFLGAFLSMPFVLQFLLTQAIYPIETRILHANPLNYSNAFSLQVEVKNNSKFSLNKCFLRLEVLKNPHNFVEERAFKLFVKKSYTKTFKEKILPKESKVFSFFIDNYPYLKTAPYQVSLFCL
ncbi:DUF2393 family protein [Helicobacter acinonychis]|uniref:DUF2393 domain-containing protein n=1 Tax=Helicobacter acinonychis (strain Sheeba) TaxID=382638 RepID=Q17W73_HELAH|nr:DUF2393 family protein [Helicobacter acinonychis]CAK00103.1 conserved hypothetical protein [Helicobacter acinonychis str. Sheeba]STP03585.1 Uncharacterised protein [Helicobacter acinonychis]